MCRAANGRASCFFSCVQPTIAATHPLPASLQIGKGSAAHVIIRREHAVEDLKQLRREHRGIGQPVGQHKGKGALKGVVGEDAGIEEAAEKGLQGGIPLSFLPARQTKVGMSDGSKRKIQAHLKGWKQGCMGGSHHNGRDPIDQLSGLC